MCGNFITNPVGTLSKDVTGSSTGVFGKFLTPLVNDAALVAGGDLAGGALLPAGVAGLSGAELGGALGGGLAGSRSGVGGALTGAALGGLSAYGGEQLGVGTGGATGGPGGGVTGAGAVGGSGPIDLTSATSAGDSLYTNSLGGPSALTGTPAAGATPSLGDLSTSLGPNTGSVLSTTPGASASAFGSGNNLYTNSLGGSNFTADAASGVTATPGAGGGSAGSGGAGGSGASGSGTNILGGSKTTDWSQLTSSPLSTLAQGAANNPGAAVGALGLGYQALQGSQLPAGDKPLEAQAGALGAQASQMMSYLNSGKLPPAIQNTVDQATNAQKAQLRQQYAAMGLSGSTMEQQALSEVDSQASTQAFNMTNQLVQQGQSEADISAQLYATIAAGQQQENQDLMNSIGNFATALSGGGTTTTTTKTTT